MDRQFPHLRRCTVGKVKKIILGMPRGLRLFLALAGLFLLASVPAFSQGCALCYTQAASSGAKMIAALKSGILVLVVPPTLASVGMLFVVHRKRNQVRRDASDDWDQDDWGNDERGKVDWGKDE
jgi:hypothetical protein